MQAIDAITQQHLRFKHRHPDSLAMIRNGDCYEMIGSDAETASKALGLTLTKRTGQAPSLSIPVDAAETYMRQLFNAGHRVGAMEQMVYTP